MWAIRVHTTHAYRYPQPNGESLSVHELLHRGYAPSRGAHLTTGSTHMIRLFRRRRRSVRLDATGPATVYTARAGAYRTLCDQPTVIFDSRPLLTPLARQRACQR